MSDARTTEELVGLLRAAAPKDAERILYEIARRDETLDASVLIPHLARSDAAFDCALKCRDLALVEPCAAQLDKQWKAALVLATLGQRQYTAAIVARLAKSEGVAADGYAMSLEIMGDDSCVPALLALVAEKNPKRAFALHHALVALTGRRPLIERSTRESSASDWPRAVAAAWERPALDEPACVAFRQGSPREATFALDHARGNVLIDYTAFTAGSWPRWSRALFVARKPLYEVSSGCGTCRTILRSTGALPKDASSSAPLETYRSAVASMQHVDRAAIDALWPLLRELDSGHYLAALSDIALERVEQPNRSWLARRASPDDELGREQDAPENYWAKVHHYQSRPSNTPALNQWAVLVPSQDPTALDEARVGEWRRAIESGARPAVVALTWVEDRPYDIFEGDAVDRFALGVVLDGHHKLEAYARAKVPARVLSLVHCEQCSTNEAPEAAFRSVVAAVGSP
ncbi:MAG: hypothetical protein JNK05_32435 [Myxococcales bacterium]|nr:hypothetical protein [Myxococcales bacterium]